ncbi:wd repeat-containing protein hypothetical protein [Limosa lapponica baueri]|uniref:Uncharacterized protein n=1 Tax=Limosa lapponica baueri TaxID=1758121 RepID=A0A2I0T2W6_LIMLA|nr:wd repeat-containing protein hypothetical protein [Limosa lapponica baueri]
MVGSPPTPCLANMETEADKIIDKDIKENWPQYRALGGTTRDRTPTGFNSIHHHSLGPALQPVFNPAESTPIQAMGSQFLQEDTVGD